MLNRGMTSAGSLTNGLCSKHIDIPCRKHTQTVLPGLSLVRKYLKHWLLCFWSYMQFLHSSTALCPGNTGQENNPGPTSVTDGICQPSEASENSNLSGGELTACTWLINSTLLIKEEGILLRNKGLLCTLWYIRRTTYREGFVCFAVLSHKLLFRIVLEYFHIEGLLVDSSEPYHCL